MPTNFTVTQDDPTGISDGALAVGSLGTVSDTTGLTDDATPVVAKAPVSDSVGLTDGTPLAGVAGSTTDMVGLGDQGTRSGLAGTTTDNAGLDDGFNVTVINTPAFNYNQVIGSESGMSDFGVQYDYADTQNNTTGLTDTVTLTFVSPDSKIFNDAAGASDTVSKSRSIVISDTVGLRDAAQPVNSGGTNWTLSATDIAGSGDSVIKYQYVPEPAIHVTLHHPHPPHGPGAVAGSRQLHQDVWTNLRRVPRDESTWIGPISVSPSSVVLRLAVVPAAATPTDPDFSSPFYVSGRPGYLFAQPTVGTYAMWARDAVDTPTRFATINVT